jgi:hypothetical protein
MDSDIPYFDGDLNSDCCGKTWFAVIQVESNESSISRIDCPPWRKVVISVVLGMFEGLLKLTWQPGIVLSHLLGCSYELP